MTDKLPLNLDTGLGTMGGTEPDSVYFSVAENNNAVMGIRPLVFNNRPMSDALLVLGARVRVQLKGGNEFPVVPIDAIREQFGFPELEVKEGNRHASVMIGVPVTTVFAMFHFTREEIAKHKLLDLLVDGFLARLPKTLKIHMKREQLLEIYTNALDDRVPNMKPGPLKEYKLLVGEELGKVVFDAKPIPVE